jgi:hypothetical protein
MSKEEYTHLLVPRLSIAAVQRGVICPEGLDDEEFAKLVADARVIGCILHGINAEITRRKEARELWRRDNVVQFKPRD